MPTSGNARRDEPVVVQGSLVVGAAFPGGLETHLEACLHKGHLSHCGIRYAVLGTNNPQCMFAHCLEDETFFNPCRLSAPTHSRFLFYGTITTAGTWWKPQVASVDRSTPWAIMSHDDGVEADAVFYKKLG